VGQVPEPPRSLNLTRKHSRADLPAGDHRSGQQRDLSAALPKQIAQATGRAVTASPRGNAS
jgi:hypothetical protein